MSRRGFPVIALISRKVRPRIVATSIKKLTVFLFVLVMFMLKQEQNMKIYLIKEQIRYILSLVSGVALVLLT